MSSKKKEFEKGVATGAAPFEKKFNDLGKKLEANNTDSRTKLDQLNKTVAAATERLNQATENIRGLNDNVQNINGDVQAHGQMVNTMLANLSKQERIDLYQINTEYDVSTLDETERQHLIGLLYTFSGKFDVNDLQQKYLRHLQAYLEVTEPQIGVQLSSIENIDSLNVQKIYLQVMMEYDYLNDADHYEEEALSDFNINRRNRDKIKQTIKNITAIVGPEGLIEKYGANDMDAETAARIAAKKAHEQIEAERKAFDAEKAAYQAKNDAIAEKMQQSAAAQEQQAAAEKTAFERQQKTHRILVDNLSILSKIPILFSFGTNYIASPTLETSKTMLEQLERTDNAEQPIINSVGNKTKLKAPKFSVHLDNSPEQLILFADMHGQTPVSAWMQIFDDGTVYFEQKLATKNTSFFKRINDGFSANLALQDNASHYVEVSSQDNYATSINSANFDQKFKKIKDGKNAYGFQKIKFNLKDVIKTECVREHLGFESLIVTFVDDTRVILTASLLEIGQNKLFQKMGYMAIAFAGAASVKIKYHFNVYQELFDKMSDELKNNQ